MTIRLVLDLTTAHPRASVVDQHGFGRGIPLRAADPVWPDGASEPDGAAVSRLVSAAVDGVKAATGSSPSLVEILHPVGWPTSASDSLRWAAVFSGVDAGALVVRPRGGRAASPSVAGAGSPRPGAADDDRRGGGAHPALRTPVPVPVPVTRAAADPGSQDPTIRKLVLAIALAAVVLIVIAGALAYRYVTLGEKPASAASGPTASEGEGHDVDATVRAGRTRTDGMIDATTRSRPTTSESATASDSAEWAETYGAIAYDTASGDAGYATDFPTEAEAEAAAADQNRGDVDVTFTFGPGECGAVATGTGRYGWAVRSSRQEASAAAENYCAVDDCATFLRVCSDSRRHVG